MLVRGNIIRYSGDSQLYEIIRIETDCLRVRRLRDGRTNYLDERDCSFVQERKFQVGDLVRATCRSGDPYTTISEGWIGKVIEVREGSDTDIVVESLVLNPSEELGPFPVQSRFFVMYKASNKPKKRYADWVHA